MTMVAVKSIPKEKIDTNIYRELDIMTKLDHPNIRKLYSVYDDKYYIHIVMEM